MSDSAYWLRKLAAASYTYSLAIYKTHLLDIADEIEELSAKVAGLESTIKAKDRTLTSAMRELRERCIARIHQAFETELSVMHGHEEEHLIDVLRALDLEE